MIDFWLAMYSHCEDPDLGARLGDFHRSLLEIVLDDLLGVGWQITRFCTYLQGSVIFLEQEAEFRLHLWFKLPGGHPQFPQADRGMMCLIQAVSPEKLYGPIFAQIAWLGEPLSSLLPDPDPMDWIGVMIRKQGYVSIKGAEWSKFIDTSRNAPLMTGLLVRHLRGMSSRRILERALDDDR